MTMDEYLADVRRRQQRVWPREVPREVVYPCGEVSLGEHLRLWAEKDPSRVALVFYGREFTYAELDDLTDRFAGWLSSVGVAAGDRVGVFLPNCPQFYVAMFGILKLGAVHVPINPLFREHELSFELIDAGIEVVVATDDLAPLIGRLRSKTAVREVLITTMEDALPSCPTLPLPASWAGRERTGLPSSTWTRVLASPPAARSQDDLDTLAVLNYTGGTTGMPKGCEHSQRHMLYTAVTGAATSAGGESFGRGKDILLVYIPIFWIAGEDFGILTTIVWGGTVVLLSRWDPAAVLAGIEKYRVTGMLGKVENYAELMDHPDFAKHDLSSLSHPRTMSIVGKLTVQLRRRWQEAVGYHSVLREGSYGMTETHTADTVLTGFQDGDHDLISRPLFCGLPVPGTEFAVVDEVTREPMPLGEEGEILVRSPSMMRQYWNSPDATSEALRDGWLHTGDIGILDQDGCLHFLARRKEMIKVNGMSVFPSEVEALLRRHRDVVDAAIVPMVDPQKGQIPLAFVELATGASADLEELTEWSRRNMATYKVPRFRFLEHLPVTGTGKINKGELLQEAQRIAGLD